MKKVMLKTTLSLAVTLASTQLFASGFALNEQSISGMGTGFAGRSSSADDASTVYGNPAGMSFLKRDQITGGVAAIDASTDIRDASGSRTGTNKGDMVPFTAVPMLFAVKKLDDQWAFGLGVYAPFGLITNYESSFQGRNQADKSEVKVVTFQPTVSYAFNDKVSIGFGPTINRISGTLSSALKTPFSPNDGEVEIKGDDVGYGYNIGVLVQATDTTRVGLTYHSKVNYKLEGHTTVTPGAGTPSPVLKPNRYDASLKIETPESYDLSVTQDLSDAWKLYAGTTWTRWSRLKDITVNNEGVTVAAGGAAAPTSFTSIKEEQNWHDTWAYAVGTSYQLNKQWVLRTGLTFDQAPTNNTDRSPRIPTGDRTIFSLGAGYAVTDDLTIDVAYSYLKEEKVKVSGDNGNQTYNSEFKNSANGFGVGATYKF
ncbi:OmpP1/FadL family transporter [Pseudomonas gingeri]|uniref:OmpP1/FadL family transporter n=1 Tax=Pseudomonas gingeri TaxID=117681 RepID=UPI0015A1A22A|nr:outer membrane protein transport protein [Pseudomonas gingeri]NVZ26966.1 outer membrane protein transport protein [Pseudomonas gingeri]NVZ99701.1 outer membrane protein transport protein [Pseudomonas gingeri]NWA16541.1 outer membrane protein transport protein [Pseudomonas gingeri]NWA54073.1 outer membrane protein transport protein [Pseudomonas gingeri]NWA98579.1 outer membrane protein transport protein [Pseudomonas gingeri]